jgi:hypothetical protein
MSKASEARINLITRPRSPEEIQKEYETAPARHRIVVSNGQEIELPATPGESARSIGTLAPQLAD